MAAVFMATGYFSVKIIGFFSTNLNILKHCLEKTSKDRDFKLAVSIPYIYISMQLPKDFLLHSMFFNYMANN